MKRSFLVLPVLTIMFSIAGWSADKARSAAEIQHGVNIPLWEDGKVPLAQGDGPLDKPFLTVFPAPANKRNGASVVIAPGGSNIMLMYGLEGIDIAETYNDWGVTAFVLTYRMAPRYKDDARTLDGTRAIQIVRARAADYGLDPERVGYIGFSAGSTMGRLVVGASGPGDPNSADPVARLSSRPAYAGLIYGPGRGIPNENLKNFPPIFMCAAQWDRGNSVGSAQLFQDLTRAGAVAELHLYQKGRHGFGSGFGSQEFSLWMPELKHFLEQGGFLTAAKGAAK